VVKADNVSTPLLYDGQVHTFRWQLQQSEGIRQAREDEKDYALARTHPENVQEMVRGGVGHRLTA
jgi:hypothetical protein